MILKYKIHIIIIFIFLCGVIAAQSRSEVDTNRAFNFSLLPEVLNNYEVSTNYLLDMYKLSFFKDFIDDTTNVWIRTRMMTGLFLNEEQKVFNNGPSELLNPLYNSYLDSQKYSTLYSIIGSVQIGAVTYLAYKHIKKYGFLKKK